MKTIYLVRHAKSSWSDEKLIDIERPLRSRGIIRAKAIADILLTNRMTMDVMWTSPAQRARDTAILFFVKLHSPQSYIDIKPDLYFTSAKKVLKSLVDLPSSCQSVGLFGHQPITGELCELLCNKVFDNVPTAGVIKINLDIRDWSAIKPQCGEYEAHWFAKELGID